MLRQGPLPALVHGVLEYIAAVALIVAPFVLAFEDGRATAASIVLGLALLALTATSTLPTALVKSVSVGVHVAADVGLALLLVALPFVLGFSEETPPTAFFLVLGVVHLLLTIATRFPDGAREDSPGRSGRSVR